MASKTKDPQVPSTSKTKPTEADSYSQKDEKDLELDRLAREELLREAKRASDRVDSMGTQGWLKPRVPQSNKRFLKRLLNSQSVEQIKERKEQRKEHLSSKYPKKFRKS